MFYQGSENPCRLQSTFSRVKLVLKPDTVPSIYPEDTVSTSLHVGEFIFIVFYPLAYVRLPSYMTIQVKSCRDISFVLAVLMKKLTANRTSQLRTACQTVTLPMRFVCLMNRVEAAGERQRAGWRQRWRILRSTHTT